SLLPVAASVRILELPGLPPKGDVTDWKACGGTREQLLELADKLEALTADALEDVVERWALESDTRAPRAGPGNGEPAAAEQNQTQAQVLLELAAAAELFHTPHGDPFAYLRVGGHRETWFVRGKGFRRWLVRSFYQKCGKPPGAQALQDAI